MTGLLHAMQMIPAKGATTGPFNLIHWRRESSINNLKANLCC